MTTTIRVYLQESHGCREACKVCGELVDKLEDAGYFDQADDDYGPICLRCVVAGDAHIRTQLQECTARHRQAAAWHRAQQQLDQERFAEEIAQAAQNEADQDAWALRDEEMAAASWELPSREDLAAHFEQHYREYAGDFQQWEVDEAVAYVRDLTGITISVPGRRLVALGPTNAR